MANTIQITCVLIYKIFCEYHYTVDKGKQYDETSGDIKIIVTFDTLFTSWIEDVFLTEKIAIVESDVIIMKKVTGRIIWM